MIKDRVFETLLTKVCEERGIRISKFCSGWLFLLEKGSWHSLVLGYDFGLNSASAHMVSKDKCAASVILAHYNVPCVEHLLVHSPRQPEYLPPAGNWQKLLAFFAEHGGEIVCKPNEGTGGADVYRVTTLVELESALYTIFTRSRTAAVCRYVPVSHEYRVYVVSGSCELIYEKVRPHVTGDGIQTVQELIIKHYNIACIDKSALDEDVFKRLGSILPKDELVLLNWRHNLGQGAVPRLIVPGRSAYQALSQIALQAAGALNLSLGAIDIVEAGGKYMVLEANSGIMMEVFSQSEAQFMELASSFYTKIIDALLSKDLR